jgi:hypothetical protein
MDGQLYMAINLWCGGFEHDGEEEEQSTSMMGRGETRCATHFCERSDGFDGEEGLKIRKTPLRWLAGC